jgi:hypothetical protein
MRSETSQPHSRMLIGRTHLSQLKSNHTSTHCRYSLYFSLSKEHLMYPFMSITSFITFLRYIATMPWITLFQQWICIPLVPSISLTDLFPWFVRWCHRPWYDAQNISGVLRWSNEYAFPILFLQELVHITQASVPKVQLHIKLLSELFSSQHKYVSVANLVPKSRMPRVSRPRWTLAHARELLHASESSLSMLIYTNVTSTTDNLNRAIVIRNGLSVLQACCKIIWKWRSAVLSHNLIYYSIWLHEGIMML